MDEEPHGQPTAENVATSSRSVSNLSLEKLYRKRAIDRENQRLLRNKNKTRLTELENALTKLTQDLADSESARRKLEADRNTYRSKIDSAISVLQSLQSSEPHDIPGQQLSPSGTSPKLPICATTIESTDTSQLTPNIALSLDARHGLSPGFWTNGGSLTFPLDGPTPLNLHEFSLNLENLTEDAFDCDLPTSLQGHDVLEPHSQELRFGNDEAFHSARVEANKIRDKVPIWGMVPTFSPPMCSMDALVVNLIEQRKRHINLDENTREFTHTDFPSVSSLLNPVLYEPDKPVASTIARHVASVIRVHTTPEKIALLYTMCIFIRWLICPTEHNYDCIPGFLRPTGAQLTVPHPMWIGTIGWPLARERLIRYMDFSKYQDFATVINKTFSINWPHQLNGILEGTAEEGFVLTHDFVLHVRDPTNWTVGREVIEQFPFLKGCVNVK